MNFKCNLFWRMSTAHSNVKGYLDSCSQKNYSIYYLVTQVGKPMKIFSHIQYVTIRM